MVSHTDKIFSKIRLLWLLILLTGYAYPAYGNGLQEPEKPATGKQREIFYKNDQGFSMGILMDRRMSNLHYTGPGGILNFGRRVEREAYVAEWHFARLQFHYARPEHMNTIVYTPGMGARYMHLRSVNTRGSSELYVGAQLNVFANFRYVPRLGNSFLFADLIAELRPQADISAYSRFLWRDWNIDFSMAASLAGYTFRFPEYGVSYQLSEDGRAKLRGTENWYLHPANYFHVTTGIFVREYFRYPANPNWFRIGYVWDYFFMKGSYNMNMNFAMHQFVFELYFRVN